MSVVLDTNFLIVLHAAEIRTTPQRRTGILSTDEEPDHHAARPVAEMDYFIAKYGGEDAARALWDDFDNGAYGLRWWAEGLHETIRVARQHPFLGLADASLVALAGILRTNRIATFDQHFRSVLTPDGEPFVVLPADR